MFLIILQNMVSSFTVIISKTILQYAQPTFYIGIRLTLAGVFLLVYQYLFRNGSLGINKKHLGLFAQVIIIRMYLAYTLEVMALERLSVARACILYNLAPLIAVIFSYFFFAEVMTSKKWLALGIGFMGLIPLMILPGSTVTIKVNGVEQVSDTFLSWSGLFMLGAVVANAYGCIIIRDLIKNKGYATLTVTSVGLFGGGILALLTSFFLEEWYLFPKEQVTPFIGQLLLIILLSNVIALNLYSFLLKKYTASFLAFAGFSYTVFGAFFGWIFLGETITWNFFVSLFLISIGLYIFYRQECKQGYIK